jgi:hypothetical protein
MKFLVVVALLWAVQFALSQNTSVPEIFGKDIISKGRIYRGSFTPDGKSFYFFKKTGEGEKYGIFVSNNVSGKWTEPERLLLGGDFSDLYPSISRDGKRMVFCSYRPVPNDASGKPNSYLWLVEKKGSGWGEPVFLDKLNTLGNYHSWVEFGKKDTIYFRNTSADWRTEYAWFSRWDGKEFSQPEPFQEVEQFRKWREDLFVWGGAFSPNGKALFLDVSEIDSATKRRMKSDIWVSLKIGNKWSEPKKLGESINSKETENFFFFSPNGKELFFAREYAAFHRISLKEALKNIQ